MIPAPMQTGCKTETRFKTPQIAQTINKKNLVHKIQAYYFYIKLQYIYLH